MMTLVKRQKKIVSMIRGKASVFIFREKRPCCISREASIALFFSVVEAKKIVHDSSERSVLGVSRRGSNNLCP